MNVCGEGEEEGVGWVNLTQLCKDKTKRMKVVWWKSASGTTYHHARTLRACMSNSKCKHGRLEPMAVEPGPEKDFDTFLPPLLCTSLVRDRRVQIAETRPRL